MVLHLERRQAASLRNARAEAGMEAGRRVSASTAAEKNLRIGCHPQEAVVVNRPIAPGAGSESFAPLGYRDCRELFRFLRACGRIQVIRAENR